MTNELKDPYQDLVEAIGNLKIAIENSQELADECVEKLQILFHQN